MDLSDLTTPSVSNEKRLKILRSNAKFNEHFQSPEIQTNNLIHQHNKIVNYESNKNNTKI
jgi:hypothetical protein